MVVELTTRYAPTGLTAPMRSCVLRMSQGRKQASKMTVPAVSALAWKDTVMSMEVLRISKRI